MNHLTHPLGKTSIYADAESWVYDLLAKSSALRVSSNSPCFIGDGFEFVATGIGFNRGSSPCPGFRNPDVHPIHSAGEYTGGVLAGEQLFDLILPWVNEVEFMVHLTERIGCFLFIFLPQALPGSVVWE